MSAPAGKVRSSETEGQVRSCEPSASCSAVGGRKDLAAFAELNADPRVMEHYPATLSRAESDALVERMEAELKRERYGILALHAAEDGRFVGYAGFSPATFEAHFTPAVEVGWRLARSEWGKGYATEPARRSLQLPDRSTRLAGGGLGHLRRCPLMAHPAWPVTMGDGYGAPRGSPHLHRATAGRVLRPAAGRRPQGRVVRIRRVLSLGPLPEDG